jgi:hypothetical protein
MGGVLGESQQLLTGTADHFVQVEEPRHVSGPQATLRQLVSADLGFRPAKQLPDIIGGLSRAGPKAAKLGGEEPPPGCRTA